MVPQHICHTNPHATANLDHLDQCASLSTANHDHQGCQQKALMFTRQTMHPFSMMPDACGSLPPSSVQQTMDHTLSKSSAVNNTNGPATTFTSITQMLIKFDKHVTTNVAPTTSTHLTCHPGSATSTTCCTHNTSASCNCTHTCSTPHAAEDTCCAHTSPVHSQLH